MTDQMKEEPENKKNGKTPEEENQQGNGSNFREFSYFVMFIGAVFVVNAMETGSYRTPWPVAIITTLAGLGLFGYSAYLQSHKQ